jgi:hypothetical protein
MTHEQIIVYNYLKKQGYTVDRSLWELKNIILQGDLSFFIEIIKGEKMREQNITISEEILKNPVEVKFEIEKNGVTFEYSGIFKKVKIQQFYIDSENYIIQKPIKTEIQLITEELTGKSKTKFVCMPLMEGG